MVNQLDRNGNTPLHKACHFENLGSARLLLHAGADVNQANRNGVTPLQLACYDEKLHVIELLLSAGADVNN